MSELLEKIRSRGYWKVIIRPATFVEKRVADRSALLPILEKTSVDLKGWSFPHIDSFQRLDTGSDWIGQELSWDSINELWRFYQSGQFVHYFGMPEDWNGHDNQMLGVADIVLRFTEIFEFAARLAFADVIDDVTRMEITVANVGERLLKLREYGFEKATWIPRANESEMLYKKDLSRSELVAETRELSLDPALELLRRFQWNPGIDIVRDFQGELLRKRPLATWRR